MIEVDYKNICTNEPRSTVSNKVYISSIFNTNINSNRDTDSSSLDISRSHSSSKKYLLPPIHNKYKYTVVLDLDETLIHSLEKNGETKEILIRPHARDFINTFGKMYELVIFTAAVKEVYLYNIVCRLDNRSNR